MNIMKYRLDVRISGKDRATLKKRCRQFDMSQADFLRMMINLPAEALEAGMAGDVFVIDRWGVVALARQVRHLGYLYNQAAHALNALARYARQNKLDTQDVLEVMGDTKKKLEQVAELTNGVEARLEEIVGMRFGIAFFTPYQYGTRRDVARGENGEPLLITPGSVREYQVGTDSHGKHAAAGGVSTMYPAMSHQPSSAANSGDNMTSR